MAGPFKTIKDACLDAKPCGFTEVDDHGNPKTPAKTTHCPALENPDGAEPNADKAQLTHARKARPGDGGVSWQIASQLCDSPRELRGETDIEYVFVHRGDGWWRSTPVWQWSYNDKYCGGQTTVRWNDQPGHTFLGLALAETCLACGKQANETTTLELMVRLDPGDPRDKTPIVFPPLVMAEREKLVNDLGGSPDATCKLGSHADELVEHWSASGDELELTGAASWGKLFREDGVLTIAAGVDKEPSSVGRYRFVH
jgi:hypothetical protein